MKLRWIWAGLLGLGLVLSGVGVLLASPLSEKETVEMRHGGQSSGTPSQDTHPAAPAAAAPPITDGPTLFRERGCSQCHEIRGVGGHKGPDLSGVGRRMKKDAILKQIEEGSNAMPAFGGVIEENEIAALVKYLGHCKDKTRGKSNVVPVVPAPAAEPAE